eukprot:bmy_17331T0
MLHLKKYFIVSLSVSFLFQFTEEALVLIEKIGLRTKDIRSFPALTELVAAATDQATAEQP